MLGVSGEQSMSGDFVSEVAESVEGGVGVLGLEMGKEDVGLSHSSAQKERDVLLGLFDNNSSPSEEQDRRKSVKNPSAGPGSGHGDALDQVTKAQAEVELKEISSPGVKSKETNQKAQSVAREDENRLSWMEIGSNRDSPSGQNSELNGTLAQPISLVVDLNDAACRKRRRRQMTNLLQICEEMEGETERDEGSEEEEEDISSFSDATEHPKLKMRLELLWPLGPSLTLTFKLMMRFLLER